VIELGFKHYFISLSIFSGEMFENLSDVIFHVIIYQYMLVIGES